MTRETVVQVPVYMHFKTTLLTYMFAPYLYHQIKVIFNARMMGLGASGIMKAISLSLICIVHSDYNLRTSNFNFTTYYDDVACPSDQLATTTEIATQIPMLATVPPPRSKAGGMILIRELRIAGVI